MEKLLGELSCVSCSLAEEPANFLQSLRKIFFPHHSFCICKRGILKESQSIDDLEKVTYSVFKQDPQRSNSDIL